MHERSEEERRSRDVHARSPEGSRSLARLKEGGRRADPSHRGLEGSVSQRRVMPTRSLSPLPPAPLAAALEQFERAAEYVHLEPALREILRVPRREWTVRFPVELDDGSTRVFTGYRVHHNLS